MALRTHRRFAGMSLVALLVGIGLDVTVPAPTEDSQAASAPAPTQPSLSVRAGRAATALHLPPLPLLAPLPTPALPLTPPAPAVESGTLQLSPSQLGGPLDPAVVGVDQMGGGAQGIWDSSPPGSTTPLLYPAAAALTSSMHLGIVRMEPSVNAVPGCIPNPAVDDCGQYRWQDHIGPTASRPGRSPEMGPDDYMTMLRTTAPGTPPFVVANMETASVQDVAAEVAYMNGTTGPMASLRQTDTGGAGPYDVVYWELGNEEGAHADMLRAELSDPARNPGGCPDYTRSGASDYTVGELYGCLLAGYASAMRTADVSSGGRVALHIVADFTGTSDWMRGMLATASGAFDDVDYHDYNEPSDPSNVVFDTDGQWTSFTVHPVTGALPAEVTYAFWATSADGYGTPILEAELDGAPLILRHACGLIDCVGGQVTTTNSSPMPQLFLATALTSPKNHQLAVTACSPTGATMSGTCPAAGSGSGLGHLVVNLRHVSTAMGYLSTADMSSTGRQGMLAPSCFSWRPDPDALVNTATGTTEAGSPTQPWRLSPNDFALAATADVAPATVKEMSALQSVVAARPGTGLFVGEHADWGGCDAAPLDLLETHEAGLAAVEQVIGYLSSAAVSTVPFRGAALFQLNNYAPNSPYCAGWAMLREVSGTVNGQTDCLAANRPDAAYLTGLGEDFTLLGALTAPNGGRLVPMTTSGPTVDVPRVVDTPPVHGVPAVSGIAFQYPDGSVRLLLVNALPATSVGETIGGMQVTSATATSVAAPPESANTDGAQSVVAPRAIATSVSAGQVTLTLPAFSCTVVVLN